MGTKTSLITGKELLRHRRLASLTIDAAAVAFSTRLNRLITVNMVAGWENNFIAIPLDVRLDMLAPTPAAPIPGSRDPHKLWAQLEHRLKPSALAAARAMCQLRDDGDEHKACPCSDTDRNTCRAFALFGREAVAAVVAADRVQKGRLHAGVYSVDWQRGDT